jgi:hypothetical protein
VIDGWSVSPGFNLPTILTRQSGQPVQLRVAPYTESDAGGLSQVYPANGAAGRQLRSRYTGHLRGDAAGLTLRLILGRCVGRSS